MTSTIEEDVPSAKLMDRKVAKLLFSYLFRYRGTFALALLLVTVITGSKLVVPYLSSRVIDRSLVKTGFCVHHNISPATTGPITSFDRLLTKAITLDDSTLFLFQPQLSALSKKEVRALKDRGVLSSEQRVLVEAASLSPALTKKIADGSASGEIRKYGVSYYCFVPRAFGRFTLDENKELRKTDWRATVQMCAVLLALFFLQFLASYFQIIALMKLSQRAMRDLRLDLYRHVTSLELAWFDRNPVGRLVNRVTNDIESLNEMFSSVLVTLFQDILIMAGVVVIMACTDFSLTLVIAATFPFLAVAIMVFRVKARSIYRVIRTTVARLNAFLNENITGIRITQIFAQEAKQLAKFNEANHDVYAANVKQLRILAVFRPLIDFFRWVAVAGVIVLGAHLLGHGSLSYGIIVMFLAYIANLFEPLGDLAEKFDILQSANAAGEKILSVLRADAVGETTSGADIARFTERYCTVNRTSLKAMPFRFKGEIVFDNVWSSYTEGDWILKGVSFSVRPRQTLAIVGETGSGKSTIISLLTRMYPYQKGAITVDGMALSDIPYAPLRGSMAVVMQDVFLFSRSVKENLLLGAPFDENKFAAVTSATHVNRFIGALPLKADTMVMERGVTFSAGERQLCAFARALYADPSILVLDEATSNIDTFTESLIQDAIKNLVRDRTSIIIAHRLSTVRNADKIIVLNKGVVAEEGNHDGLIAKKGLYYELYNLQIKKADG
jgi:ABC-type multidrug transport system fused ATPase/permease subunit